jgi:hypothetical protein
MSLLDEVIQSEAMNPFIHAGCPSAFYAGMAAAEFLWLRQAISFV